MTSTAQASSTVGLMRAPVLVAVAAGSAALVLHTRDPHDSGTYGYCPFLAVTGLPCPGCGGLRAVNDLTRGDVVGAVSSNVLAVALVVVLAVAWVLWVLRRARGRRDRMIVAGPRTAVAVIAVLVAFGAFRLTPWGSWLAP